MIIISNKKYIFCLPLEHRALKILEKESHSKYVQVLNVLNMESNKAVFCYVNKVTYGPHLRMESDLQSPVI